MVKSTKVWLVSGVVLIALGLMVGLRAQPSAGAPGDAMSVALAVPGPKDVGVQFDVNVSIDVAEIAYAGAQANIKYDPTILAWNPVGAKGWTYYGLGDMTNDFNAEAKGAPPDDAVKDSTYGGSARASGTSNATGLFATVNFSCLAAGTSTLHLVTLAEYAPFATFLVDADAAEIQTSLTDATVTCGAGGPVATPSAPTATPGGPAPTPSVSPPPGATPTPLPPGYEAVDLAAACNPVTTTYPNATPAQSVAAAVGPAGNLQALWKFGGNVWLGYSPAFPQASDLTALDLLDVVFICVGGPGSFARPII
jgi:hypothetical protein